MEKDRWLCTESRKDREWRQQIQAQLDEGEVRVKTVTERELLRQRDLNIWESSAWSIVPMLMSHKTSVITLKNIKS
jgi:hypothetical protein